MSPDGEGCAGADIWDLPGSSHGRSSLIVPGCYSALLARNYAPELQLVGVAAAAPATDLATLMKDDRGTGGGNNITAMTLWSWSKIYDAPITPVIKSDAMPVINHLASECIERWFDILTRRGPTVALEKSFLKVDDLADIEPWRRLLAENTPGPLPSDIPVFVAQGSADGLMRPSVTEAYVEALCRRGSKVQFDLMHDVGHAFIARDAAYAAIAWIASRFGGGPPADNCRPG
jgi:Secretory lipase